MEWIEEHLILKIKQTTVHFKNVK